MASCSSSKSSSSSCSNMSCRFCPRASVESAAADYVGAALPPSSAALPRSRVVADLLLSALPFSFFSFLFPFDTWYDSSSSPSSELLDMLDDALVVFSSSSFFFLPSLLFLLDSLLSLLSSFLCFFSSNHYSSFFSLVSLFSFLASFLLLLSLSLELFWHW